VCSDIILFQKLKLTYFRGNYDAFENARDEMKLVQQRQFEAQQVKLQHMQDFVDKFRFNAKRASLVQSRIKTIEKETKIDAVEEEEKSFQFFFIDAGQLGRPIIQIEKVFFGYSLDKMLFKHVDLDIDQQSRIALVGNNGVGKVFIFYCLYYLFIYHYFKIFYALFLCVDFFVIILVIIFLI
jgi:ATP-binding cassette subfamily F protein 3